MNEVILSGVKALRNGVEESREQHVATFARFFDSARLRSE